MTEESNGTITSVVCVVFDRNLSVISRKYWFLSVIRQIYPLYLKISGQPRVASAASGSRRYRHIGVYGSIPIPSEVTDRRAGQVGITKTGCGVTCSAFGWAP
jgi:hypothetical protein